MKKPLRDQIGLKKPAAVTADQSPTVTVPAQAVPTRDTTKVAANPAPKAEAPAQVAPPPKLLHTCGHVAGNRPCPECLGKARRERAARKRAKAQARPQAATGGRLPDGARFVDVVYDAASQSWTGRLVIAGCPEFVDTCSGVFGLLGQLDGQYRAWLARPAAPTPASD